ncbi:MAG: hypothetical protein AB8U44_02270 [Aaplasma endosymbiont of Hyalomma asiaticum]
MLYIVLSRVTMPKSAALAMGLFVVVVLSLLTVVSLIVGVVLSSAGGSFYEKYKNKIMLLRVVLQAMAVASAVFLIK